MLFPLLGTPPGRTNPQILQTWLTSISNGVRCGGEYKTSYEGILRESKSLSQFLNGKGILGVFSGAKVDTSAVPRDPATKPIVKGHASEVINAIKANISVSER